MAEPAPEVGLHWDEVDGTRTGVAVLTLQRQERMNALTVSMGAAFEVAIGSLAMEPDLRAVVLTGAGKAFSAGGDLDFLEERAAASPQHNSEEMRAFYRRYLSVRQLPVPVLAAVQGPAIGAGLCLALACDVRIAATKAKLGFTFVSLGLHPGMGATFFLPALVGPQAASRLLLTGDVIDGEEAARLGLVSEAVPDAETLEVTLAYARRMAAAGPVAVRSLVRSLRLQDERGLEQALWREADAQAQCYATSDFLRGISALRDKSKAKFEGR
ncbi:MAG: enoyl-CoA hydratase/isomerase family protein [Myxococcota bacterium]